MPVQFMPHQKKPQAVSTVALSKNGRYSLPVAANSATGRGNPFENLAHRRPHYDCRRLFLRLRFRVMAAVCGQASAWPGSKFPGISTPCTAATQSRGKDRGSSIVKTWSATYARPKSVQNSRRSSSSNGSRRFTRQLQPRNTPFPLQRPYVQGSRSGSRRGCPMSMLPGFALPEDLLCVSQDAEAGLPIDAITCALDRADSVLMLLEDHLDGDKPLLSNRVLSSVIWDVRGTLGLIKTLTMYGDASSVPMGQKGGAL
ncbi:ash family protein [Pseudomonas sp. BF61]|nr:ash family protein [Pseudomonas sp. BF61]